MTSSISTVGLIAITSLASCATMVALQRVAAPSVVTAQSFSVVDDKGVERISLGPSSTGDSGKYELTFFGPDGDEKWVRLVVDPRETRLVMNHGEGHNGVWIDCRDNQSSLNMFGGLDVGLAQRVSLEATPETGSISLNKGEMGTVDGKSVQFIETLFQRP